MLFFVKFRGVSGAGKGTQIKISQRKARPSRLHILHVFTFLKAHKLYFHWTLVIYTTQHP